MPFTPKRPFAANEEATTKHRGLMTAVDKAKLLALQAIYTISAPLTLVGNALGISAATQAAAGSMSAADKTKLDNLYNPYNTYGTELVSNFNTLARSGFYEGFNATGAPVASVWYWILHFEHYGGDGYSWQQARRLDANEGIVYQRVRIGNVWGGWYAWAVEPTGWVDLNSIAPYGANWGPTAFGNQFRPMVRRTSNGEIRFRGIITKSTAPVAGDVMFTMPAGWRNVDAGYLSGGVEYIDDAATSVTTSNSDIRLRNTGEAVYLGGGVPAGGWISIAGLSAWVI